MFIACTNQQCAETGIPKDTLGLEDTTFWNGVEAIKCGECGQNQMAEVTPQAQP